MSKSKRVKKPREPKRAYWETPNGVEHILGYYYLASEGEKEQGEAWYPLALRIAQRISKRYGLPVDIVAGVIAALSPRCPWEKNLLDAEQACKAFVMGIPRRKLSCNTFGKNVTKAFQILAGDMGALRGPKVVPFSKAILGDLEQVVVDTHAVGVWADLKVKDPDLNERRIADITRDYREAARILGVKPAVVQAITWLVFRRLNFPVQRSYAQQLRDSGLMD